MLTKEQESTGFVRVWKSKPSSYRHQGIKEVASWFQESDREIDRYFFDEDADGDFVSGNIKVKDCIKRYGFIGQVEGQAVDSMEIAKRAGAELFFWVSPPYPDIYPDLKIIITEAVNYQGKRRWLNRAIIFDYDDKRSLEFAKELAVLSKNKPEVNSLEDIRINPLVMDIHQDWAGMLAKAAHRSDLEDIIKNNKDEILQQQAIEKATAFYDEIIGSLSVELAVTDIRSIARRYGLGRSLSSCPELLTGSQAFLRNSSVIRVAAGVESSDGEKANRDKNDRDYCVHCGACGKIIDLVVRSGELCPGPKVGDKNIKEASCGEVRKC